MLENKTKIKITISDTAPLYPPRWGGPRRIWNLYGNFSPELFDTTYVGVTFEKIKDARYKYQRIRSNFKEILSAFPPHYYFWHAIEKAIFRNTSLDLFVYLGMHTDWQFKYILNSQNADIIICSHPWSSLCIDKNNRKFFIYDAHNCEYLLMDRILKNHILKGLILRQVRQIEADACKKSNLMLVCSEKEKKDFIDLYDVDADKIIVVSNGANIDKNNRQAAGGDYRTKLSLLPKDKVIIFIGAYYKPNIDAARFIIEKLSHELKEFKFLIIGTVFGAFKKEQLPSNVKLLGWITDEDLDTVLRASDIAINPMFDGSGVNIKMLEYMSYGLPIVTTECGSRGIETNGKHPMIVSTIGKFIDNIRMLSNDSLLYKKMSADGRSLAAESYDWEAISSNLQEMIVERFRRV